MNNPSDQTRLGLGRSALLLILLALFTFSVAPSVAAGRTTVSGYLASPSIELLEKAFAYVRQKDEKALEQLTDAGLVIYLKGGLEVEVMDTKIFKGLIKIRPRGQTIEVWTNVEAVK